MNTYFRGSLLTVFLIDRGKDRTSFVSRAVSTPINAVVFVD